MKSIIAAFTIFAILTVAILAQGSGAGIIALEGVHEVVAPSVAARQKELADNDAAKKEAALKAHRASVAALEAAAKTEANTFYAGLKTAKTYLSYNGCCHIVSVDGDGPEAIVTLQDKNGKTQSLEAKWLQAGGVKSLGF